MSQRIYEVMFEMYDEGQWRRNTYTRNVAVIGGAEQAIKVALKREKDDRDSALPRIRVESVRILAEES